MLSAISCEIAGAPDADTRLIERCVELVADRYHSTDLVGYHEHERPVRTRQEFREAVTERFTDRHSVCLERRHCYENFGASVEARELLVVNVP